MTDFQSILYLVVGLVSAMLDSNSGTKDYPWVALTVLCFWPLAMLLFIWAVLHREFHDD